MKTMFGSLCDRSIERPMERAIKRRKVGDVRFAARSRRVDEDMGDEVDGSSHSRWCSSKDRRVADIPFEFVG
jgi:hypothetical protein